jgi:hypothetical protein
MSSELIRQMTETVRRDVDDMIQSGDRTSTRMVNDIARHDIPLGDPVVLGRELYGLLKDEPYVQWLACSNEAGGAIDAGRLADGTLVFLMTDGFRAGMFREYAALPDGRMGNLRKSGVYLDTRQKPWFTQARDTRKGIGASRFSAPPSQSSAWRCRRRSSTKTAASQAYAIPY